MMMVNTAISPRNITHEELIVHPMQGGSPRMQEPLLGWGSHLRERAESVEMDYLFTNPASEKNSKFGQGVDDEDDGYIVPMTNLDSPHDNQNPMPPIVENEDEHRHAAMMEQAVQRNNPAVLFDLIKQAEVAGYHNLAKNGYIQLATLGFP